MSTVNFSPIYVYVQYKLKSSKRLCPKNSKVHNKVKSIVIWVQYLSMPTINILITEKKWLHAEIIQSEKVKNKWFLCKNIQKYTVSKKINVLLPCLAHGCSTFCYHVWLMAVRIAYSYCGNSIVHVVVSGDCAITLAVHALPKYSILPMVCVAALVSASIFLKLCKI